MGPLSFGELGEKFNLDAALEKGLLPEIYLESDRETWTKLLRSYASTYLKEEIQAEALTRNLEGFARFFDVICSRSGDFIDFTKFASLASIDRMAAKRYFDILIDTLVLHPVEAFSKSKRIRLVQHPRFYLFDVGVLNGALGNFKASPDRVGNLFEHLVLQLLFCEAKSKDKDIRISVYRTETGAEVDFILETHSEVFAIEIISAKKIQNHDLKGLKSFKKFYRKQYTPMVIYPGQRDFVIDDVSILSLSSALRKMAL